LLSRILQSRGILQFINLCCLDVVIISRFDRLQEAARAAAELNQKVILGRPLVVRPASGDETDEAGVPATRKRGAGHSMLTYAEFSFVFPSHVQVHSYNLYGRVSDKIRAIEDKLKSMEQEHQAELAHSRMTSARIMQLLRSSSLTSTTAATAASASKPADAANFLFEALAGHQSERAQQVDDERRVSAALDGVTDEPTAATTAAAAPREQSSSSSRHRSRSPDRDHKRRDDDRHKDRHKDDRHKEDRHKDDKDRKHKDRDDRRRSRSRSRGRDRRSRSRERR
jgi:hypothetical protein